MFDVIRIPAFKDNYIWLLRKEASAVVVDPGDACPVLEVLEREGLSLAAILVTHHHRDHQGGVAELLAHFPAEVFGPAGESITGITQPLRGGEMIFLRALGIEFQVLAVPGHTLGHLAYYCHDHLFCGDTLFAAGCGRLFEGSPAEMFTSLTRLATLPAPTHVYCAHEYTEANLRFALTVDPGNRHVRQRVNEVAVARAKGWATVPSTLGDDLMTNPFLRCADPAIRAAAQGRVAGAQQPVEVFAVLREWKNDF